MDRRRLFVFGLLALAASTFVPGTALAAQNADFRHLYPQVWSASVRMIRVDYGLALREQDRDIGYLLFDWRDSSGRAHPGSIELVRTVQDASDVVRVVVQIPAMPSYVEQMVLDRLGRKLKQDFGEPPAIRRPRRSPSTPPEEPPAEDAPPGDTPARNEES